MSFQGSDGWTIARRFLVAAIVTGFVLCGVRGFRAVRSRRIDGTGPLSSTDSILLPATQLHGSAERILDSLAGSPPAAPLAIVAPYGNAFGPVLLQTISEITWPHDVYLVQVGTDNFRQTIDVLRKDHFCAAIYIGIGLPDGTPVARRVGALTIAPVTQ